jgi:hypothetical protein
MKRTLVLQAALGDGSTDYLNGGIVIQAPLHGRCLIDKGVIL